MGTLGVLEKLKGSMTAKDRHELEVRFEMLEREVAQLRKELALQEVKDKEHECMERKRPELPNLPRSDT